MKVVFFEVRLPMSSRALTETLTMPVAGTYVAERSSLACCAVAATRRPAASISDVAEVASSVLARPWTYEIRFGAIPPALRAAIEATRDEGSLRAWLRVAITHPADEIAAAIRRATTS